jgi:hypothetical protein
MAKKYQRKSLESELMNTWEKLCSIFGEMSFINPRLEDIAVSLETWKDDHVSLSFKRSPQWIATRKLLETVPTRTIESLLGLSKVNATHVNSHLAFTVGAIVSIPLAIYSLAGEFMQSFLASMDISTTLATGIFFLLALIFIARLWMGKWRAMELTTCLEALLAIRYTE